MYWYRNTARSRIESSIALTRQVGVADLTSMGQLDSIGQAQAWRVNAAHAYVEILNTPSLLDNEASGNETERSHKRLLRFLHIYQRVAHMIFGQVPVARRVDFQNQRLHFLVGEPFGNESKRISAAVAVGDTLQRVLKASNTLHNDLPDAQIRVGIDCGEALAVRNGTRGDREPLFIGNPANHAAKLLAGGRQGIYLSDQARARLGSNWVVQDVRTSPLSAGSIKVLVDHAGLGLNNDALSQQWRRELQDTPLSTFSFSRPRPPLKNLDLELLTPENSRRIDAAAIYADIDGFTRFVADRIGRRKGEGEAVQALHVIRKELRDVLADFDGRKIRYNGDCLVGVLAEGGAETNRADTMKRAARCAAAMRSSFELIQELLPSARELGLAIGLDAGPVTITRLGPRGTRFRCVMGQAVLAAESIQQRCKGTETGLARNGYGWADSTVQRVLPAERPVAGFNYERAP